MIPEEQTGALISPYVDIRVPGLLMVGSYRIFRQYSIGYVVLFLLIITSCLVQWSSGNEVQTISTERVILYSEPDITAPEFLSQNHSPLSDNCSIVLRAPGLHFLVVEIPANESAYYRNELLKLPWVTGVESDVIRMPESIYNSSPDDPGIPDLWAFNRTHVSEAWGYLSLRTNSSNCTVAILDTGIDPNHEDLAGIINYSGFDWISNNSTLMDADGHGTFLAGIVGAVSENGKGIAGVARVSLLPERVGTNENGIYSSRSAMAIQHAADNGARIILMGYGGPGQSAAEESAIAYAAEKGCILIAPAGNGASNEGHYPSDYFEVISVGSTAKTDGLSYFSNYGIFVELVGPGEGIISTWPGNSYQSASGTSPAAALVAGAAALILAADPALNRDQVRAILSSTAHDLGRTGRDIYYGYGLLDIGAAVHAVELKNADGEQKDIRTNRSDEKIDPATNLPSDKYLETSAFSRVKRNGPGSLRSEHIPLESGWNFISLPSMPGSAKTSAEIFQGINTDGHTIWKYNAERQDWISIEKESNITPLEGFLIYSDKPGSIPLVIDEHTDKNEISMSPGWNLVGSPCPSPVSASAGLASLSPDWVSLLLFNKTTQTYDPAIIHGANGTHSDNRTLPAFTGFWVYMNKGGSLRSAY